MQRWMILNRACLVAQSANLYRIASALDHSQGVSMLPLKYPPSWMLLVLLCIVPPCTIYGSVRINEFVSSNGSTVADEDGDYEDWIELQNTGSTSVNLSGWSISDSNSSPRKWTFAVPLEIPPGGYAIVWASGKNRQQWVPGTSDPAVPGTLWPHTNFSIAAAGEPLSLTRPDGSLADSVPPVEVPRDWSYGRVPGLANSWAFFFAPTPASGNSTQWLEQLIAPVEFSVASGFFTESFLLTLSHPDPGAVIVYTVDGSDPDVDALSGGVFHYLNSYPGGPLLEQTYTSLPYQVPLTISDRSNQPNRISQISTTADASPGYLPTQPVQKGTVVRARAFINGVGGPISTHTYFVSNTGAFDYSLPVVSLSVSPGALFDFVEGIHVAGIDRLERRGFQICDFGNYNRRGREAEAAGHFAYFVHGDLALEHSAGIRIQGNCSRQRPFKSLRLYARNTLESPGYFEFPFFQQSVPGATGPANQRFARLTLRAPNFNDFVFSRLFQPVYEGVAGRVQPAIQFLNGEFWGLSIVRDRFDAEYLNQHFGLDPDNVAIIVIRYRHEIPPPAPFSFSNRVYFLNEGIESDMVDYLQMRSFIEGQDMADASHYQTAQNMLCLDSFIDHLILKIFAGDDHYAPEFVFWRARSPQNDSLGDGRWRVFVKDFDSSLVPGNYVSGLATGTHPRSFGFQMFASLLRNEDFRYRFINRFADLLNTDFKTDRFQQIIHEAYDEVAPYWPAVTQRWNNANLSNPHRPFTTSVRNSLLTWAAEQPSRQRTHIRNHFALGADFQLSVHLQETDHGAVRVNSRIHRDSAWSGLYFAGVPIELEALPAPGYRFAGWRVAGSGFALPPAQAQAAMISVSAYGNVAFYADFEALAEVESVYFLPSASGAWHLDANWSNGWVPDGPGSRVSIPAPGVSGDRDVNFAAPLTVGSLQFVNSVSTVRHRLRDQPTGSNLVFDNGSGEALLQVSGAGSGFVELTVAGGVVLNSDLRLHIDLVPGSQDFGALRLRENWSGQGGLIKSGAGVAALTGGGKLFSGSIRVEQGVLSFTEPAVAGLASGVFVQPGGQLRLVSASSSSSPVRLHPFGGTLHLAGTGWVDGPPGVGAGLLGALRYDPGSPNNVAALLTPIVLSAPASIHVDGSSNTLILAGRVSGASSLTKSGGGVLGFSADSVLGSLIASGTLSVDGAVVDAHTIEAPVIQAVLHQNGLQGNGVFALQAPLQLSQPPQRIDLIVARPHFPGDRLRGGVLSLSSQDLHTWLSNTEIRILVPDSQGAERVHNRRYRVAVASDDLHWRVVDGSVVEVFALGQPRSFVQWRGIQFENVDLWQDPAYNDPTADPGHTGLPLLMRYALGVDSLSPPSTRLPSLQQSSGVLEFRFPFNSAAQDIVYQVQSSTNLHDWTHILWDSSTDLSHSLTNDWIQLPLDIPSTPLFLRLVIQLAQP